LLGARIADPARVRSIGGEDVVKEGERRNTKGRRSVTNFDWIAGFMSALAIAALLWVAVAFA